jgi:nucleotide-binding universal stress UspA family protein
MRLLIYHERLEWRLSMLERILVPLDGSQVAEAILTQVRHILVHKAAEVILLRVLTIPPVTETDAGPPTELLVTQATKYVRGLARILGSQGVRVRSRVVEGRAAEGILDIAKEERATLIALATHGRSGLARWVLGSVAEKVVRASPVPVLVVRSFKGTGKGAVPVGSGNLFVKKILVPLESTRASMDIVPAVVELAQVFGSQVLLLNVCEGSACAVPVPQVTRAFDRLRESGITVEPLMRQGDAAVEILEACRQEGADLIAMTTHGHTGVSRWMLGSVAEKVLRASPVPLLIVRAARTPRERAPDRSKERRVEA